MLGSVRVITPPTVEPVLPEEVKLFIRQFDSSLDSVLAMLIPLIRGLCEDYVNRASMLQTLEYAIDGVPTDWVALPRPPFASLVSVTFYDVDGTPTVITNSKFMTVTKGAYTAIKLKDGESWPSSDPRDISTVVIQYKAGSSVVTEVPQSFKLGILTAIVACIDDPGHVDLSESAMRVLDSIREVPI
jgi:uncharacterized phiE125 gp8 family phage protein